MNRFEVSGTILSEFVDAEVGHYRCRNSGNILIGAVERGQRDECQPWAQRLPMAKVGFRSLSRRNRPAQSGERYSLVATNISGSLAPDSGSILSGRRTRVGGVRFMRISAGIAAALNARGIRSARGGEWHPATVARILGRAER
jgi:hypothetical protein